MALKAKAKITEKHDSLRLDIDFPDTTAWIYKVRFVDGASLRIDYTFKCRAIAEQIDRKKLNCLFDYCRKQKPNESYGKQFKRLAKELVKSNPQSIYFLLDTF